MIASPSPVDIGLDTALGRPLTAAETSKLQQWIDEALVLINWRVDPASVEPNTLWMVLRRVCLARWQSPGFGVRQQSVSVDDAQTSTTWDASVSWGDITDGMWALLGVVTTSYSIAPG